MDLERPIEIKGTEVLLHPWKRFLMEEKYSYKQQYDLIASIIAEMYSTSNMVPIYIEGETGSGKSVLAQVLKENGNNVEFINGYHSLFTTDDELTQMISDTRVTYIIDEAGYLSKQIINLAEEHAKNGGLIILLMQCFTEFSIERLLNEGQPKLLRLVRGKLTEVS